MSLGVKERKAELAHKDLHSAWIFLLLIVEIREKNLRFLFLRNKRENKEVKRAELDTVSTILRSTVI